MDAKRHQQRQQRLKQQVDARIRAATERRGILIIFTGNGKGKTTAGFGTLTRAVGHGLRAAVVQFIKWQWPNGERQLLEPDGVEFQVMATDFTWETQNRELDRSSAARDTWRHARRMLADASLDVVILDELTYMISFDYLDREEVIAALAARPAGQSVIITGRGCHRALLAMAYTVSEMRPVKHAFDAGVMAQQGIDW